MAWAGGLPALMLAAALSAGAETGNAEFAVRWDPRQGGPATPAEALRGLRQEASSTAHFEIRYFDFSPPADVPAGFDAILRERVSGGARELTFKLRGSQPLPARPSLPQWACPLGPTKDRKDEADVSFVGTGRTITAYSRSCSLESRQAELQPPAALQARPKGCGSTMTRLRAGALKVEEWKLADGSALLEASRPGKHSDAARGDFERQVLRPLLALGVQPLERSKSAIGGDCAR
jgi:hypothetical protein